ncbi:MAG: hypothetical protein JRH20_15310 [Deltaproteobacteria bacterium]|nr:hypothetical protein [Deltaproteobacteria bacterium]
MNSVLFSLQGLREIEDQRLAEEAAALQEQARQTREAAEHAEYERLAAKERQRLAALQREQEATETRAREKREDQLRIDETERRARVDAELVLQKRRLELELQHQSPRARRWMWIFVPFTLSTLAGVAFWAFGQRDRLDTTLRQMQTLNNEAKRAEAAFAELQRQHKDRLADLRRKRAALEQKVQRDRLHLATAPRPKPSRKTSRKDKPRPRTGPARAGRVVIADDCKNSNDPLCGILKRGP